MKSLFYIVAMMLLPFVSAGQPVALKTDTVIVVEGVKADVLYSRAKAWIGETFRSPKDVLQVDGKEVGEVSVNAIMPVVFKGAVVDAILRGRLAYTVRILVRDGRYKLVIGPFEHFADNTRDGVAMGVINDLAESPVVERHWGQGQYIKRGWTQAQDVIFDKTDALIKSVSAAMRKADDKEKDW